MLTCRTCRPCCYPAATLLLPCCYLAATLLLPCCDLAATLLLSLHIPARRCVLLQYLAACVEGPLACPGRALGCATNKFTIHISPHASSNETTPTYLPGLRNKYPTAALRSSDTSKTPCASSSSIIAAAICARTTATTALEHSNASRSSFELDPSPRSLALPARLACSASVPVGLFNRALYGRVSRVLYPLWL
jgi:hypothetical protein